MSLTFMPTPMPGNGNKLAISKRREASIEAAAACLKDKRDCKWKRTGGRKRRTEKMWISWHVTYGKTNHFIHWVNRYSLVEKNRQLWFQLKRKSHERFLVWSFYSRRKLIKAMVKIIAMPCLAQYTEKARNKIDQFRSVPVDISREKAQTFECIFFSNLDFFHLIILTIKSLNDQQSWDDVDGDMNF